MSPLSSGTHTTGTTANRERKPIIIFCRQGHLNFSASEIDDTWTQLAAQGGDSLETFVAKFNGDNTLKCRYILRDLQRSLLLAKPRVMMPFLACYDAVFVECSYRDGLTMSSLDPESSEASNLSFRTESTHECRSLCMDFLKKVLFFTPPRGMISAANSSLHDSL